MCGAGDWLDACCARQWIDRASESIHVERAIDRAYPLCKQAGMNSAGCLEVVNQRGDTSLGRVLAGGVCPRNDAQGERRPDGEETKSLVKSVVPASRIRREAKPCSRSRSRAGALCRLRPRRSCRRL